MRAPLRQSGGSDARLAVRVAGGDDAAAEILFGRHEPALRRYCQGLLGHPEDGRDATQSALERALVALRDSGPPRHLKAWLFTIAHNEAITLVARRREHPIVPEDLPAQGPDVHAIVQRRADLADLLADLQSLPERQRAALLMRELCGLPVTEIASVLQITPAATTSTIYEARDRLQHQARGRNLDCDTIRSTLSANDGRLLRARTTRAHLQVCEGCREFRSALRHRPRSLQALFPLPALAAAVHGAGAEATLRTFVRSLRRLVSQPSTAGSAAGVAVTAAFALVVLVDSGPSQPAAAATAPQPRPAPATQPAAKSVQEPRVPRSTPPQQERSNRLGGRTASQARPAAPQPTTPKTDRAPAQIPAAPPAPAATAQADAHPAAPAAPTAPMDCTAVVEGLPTPGPAAAALAPVVDVLKSLPVTVACQTPGAPALPEVPALPIPIPAVPELPPLPTVDAATDAVGAPPVPSSPDPVCAATAAPLPGTERITAPADIAVRAQCADGHTRWQWAGTAS